MSLKQKKQIDKGRTAEHVDKSHKIKKNKTVHALRALGTDFNLSRDSSTPHRYGKPTT